MNSWNECSNKAIYHYKVSSTKLTPTEAALKKMKDLFAQIYHTKERKKTKIKIMRFS